MEAHEILRAVSRKLGIKHLAAELRVSPKLFQKWTQPPGPAHDGRVNPAERVLQITRITGNPRLLEWLCEQAGGRFVQGEELRVLVCQDCERRIAELKAVMQNESRIQKTEFSSEQLGVGGGKIGNRKLEIGNAGGSRCRYRRKDGRCGFALAGRN